MKLAICSQDFVEDMQLEPLRTRATHLPLVTTPPWKSKHPALILSSPYKHLSACIRYQKTGSRAAASTPGIFERGVRSEEVAAQSKFYVPTSGSRQAQVSGLRIVRSESFVRNASMVRELDPEARPCDI